MLKKMTMVAFVCCALVLSGCSIEDDAPNFHYKPLEIVSVEVPESFDLNQNYVISVTYLRPDGCTFYEGFDVQKEAQTVRNVVALGLVRTDVEVCTQAIIEETATFNFTVIYTDTYTFKFYTGDNDQGEPEFIEVMVPVNITP